jgi:hypothetical protein
MADTITTKLKRSWLPSEAVRVELAELAAKLDANTVVDFGSNPTRPRYRMVSPARLSPNELARCVPISADQARKGWADLRALIRLLDAAFLVAAKGRPIAVLQRNPDFSTVRADWVEQHRIRNEAAASAATVEDRLSKLERAVESLARHSTSEDDIEAED